MSCARLLAGGAAALAAAAFAIVLVPAVTPAVAWAQQAAGVPVDSLRLGALQREALGVDPRQRQLELEAAQSELRLHNLGAERLPSFTTEALAQHQSDVATVPLRLPDGGRAVPSPGHEMYEARLGVQQPIVDPTISPRRRVERARLAEGQAQVRVSLFALRQEVNDAFFAAALLRERAGAIAAAVADLEHRLGEAAVRVREGAALPSDTAALRAALLQRRQDELTMRAGRTAALARLGGLRGRPIGPGEVPVLPDLAVAVAEARGRLAELRARPEYEQFVLGRDRLRQQESVVAAAARPRLSAFGRAGYGRPGLNLLGDDFHAYWIAGLQAQWAPWTWGRTRREREALAVQREIITADEAAFTAALSRAIQNDLAALDQLDSTLTMDREIVALREQIERETRLRFSEGAVTAAEYVDRSTDVLEARLAETAHRVELAQARARFLTTLGLEIP